MDKQITLDLRKLQQMRSLLNAIIPLVEYERDYEYVLDQLLMLKMGLISTLAEQIKVLAQERLDDFHSREENRIAAQERLDDFHSETDM